MTTFLPQNEITDRIEDCFSALTSLSAEIEAREWKVATALPGWDVQANISHIIGTEAMLDGRPSPQIDIDPSDLDHVKNPIAEFNEAWVIGLASSGPDEMRAQLDELIGFRVPALRSMSDEDWNKEGFTPVGTDTYGRFMRVRIFDIWMHEQDIRDALDRPGHRNGPVVETVIDEMTMAMPFVIGKRAGFPAGTSVTLKFTGDSPRSVHVAVAERASLVGALDGEATVTLTMTPYTFSRLAGGRSPHEQLEIAIEGETALAERLLTSIAYVI